MKYPDFVGKKFDGSLVVALESQDTKAKKGGRTWRLICLCGGQFTKTTNALVSGIVKARCKDCARRCQSQNAKKTNLQHGESGTHLHNVWLGIIKRCYYPKSVGYKNYGARGISIHPDWRNDYAAFAAHIRSRVGAWPGPGFTLDRIDNDKDYAPGNLRWATAKIQANNKRPRCKIPTGALASLVNSDPRWVAILKPYINRSRSAAAAALGVSYKRCQRIAELHGMRFPEREVPQS